jgi:hypothetical protein
VFFRSEEDARDDRRTKKGVRGLYLTLDHGVYLTRVIQGAVFAFSKREW